MQNEKENNSSTPLTTSKSEAALREEKVLEFWGKYGTFEKTLEKHSPKGEFVFYDGPVTANSKPVLHTMEPFSFKDAIPRYKTMRGYHVRRKGGWDTHGLPVELQIEKKLGFKSKSDIENYGIAAFNKLCRDSVWEYTELWKKFTNRIGYWADQDNAYVTYHNDFIESVWNVVKTINNQNLLYKDYKVVPWCPRCGTALSSHELAQGYQDVKDLSVTVKFKVKGKENTYILAWTTTPWTLPGNVALAVGEKLDYVKIKVGEEFLILAKARLSVVEGEYEIVEEFKGKDLLGLDYEPLYPFLANTVFETEKWKMEKAYKVYGADFVTTEDGTGVVHTAVMYGQDDFVLGTKVGLPKHHLVGLDGRFLAGTGIFEGRFVRDEDVAVDVIKDLAHRGFLFKKEKYEHSYPHCWRCKTALIYYARDSWYIRMSDPKIKEKMIAENKEINWEPSHIRDGRFGEWLREIKDWAVSRERYWGTPLPVWTCEDCKKVEVIGSLQDIKDKTKKSGNQYFVMRHGEAENNRDNIYSSDPNINHLTELGKAQVLKTAEELKDKKITKIFCSPFLRTRETAEIVAEKIGYPKDKITYEDRLHEFGFGELSGKSVKECMDKIESKDWKYDTRVPNGESFQDGKNRLGDFLYEIDKKYQNETILIVSHGFAVEVAPAVIEGADKKRSFEIFNSIKDNQTASLHKEHVFVPIPHNEDYELDLHRPYIDEVELVCECGGNLVRTKEVMDVWLDSGAMPFAQDHYPFENKEWVDGPGYPADFISEAIDQTRGWFYTLHAVGVLMGRGKAYKNVICLGHLLDAKGKKMSKSIGNIVDPWEAMDKYGVDTLRLWMYSVNQPGESKNFDEKTVALLSQQVFGLLYNVLAFHELYRDETSDIKGSQMSDVSANILDQWILTRLNELIKLSTENLDNYKLLEPTRAIRDFIGDLSTWYLRRSRDRIKEGDKEAKETLYFVLKTLVKVMAPLAPLAAEDIWLKLRNENDLESVHLTKWPEAEKINTEIIEDMKKVREVVTLGLEARQKAGLKVRQALNKLRIKNYELEIKYTELIKEELNVKEIVLDKNIETEVLLDVEITEDLKQEGDYRELVRALQDMRKKMGLTPSDVVSVIFETSEDGKKLIQKFEADMKKTVLVSKMEFKENDGEAKSNEIGSPDASTEAFREVKIDGLVFHVKIMK
jgi:isoleucyl-tRNA synthetase